MDLIGAYNLALLEIRRLKNMARYNADDRAIPDWYAQSWRQNENEYAEAERLLKLEKEKIKRQEA